MLVSRGRKYGFIQAQVVSDDGTQTTTHEEIYCPMNEIEDGTRLEVGDYVSFRVHCTYQSRWQAHDVRLVQKGKGKGMGNVAAAAAGASSSSHGP